MRNNKKYMVFIIFAVLFYFLFVVNEKVENVGIYDEIKSKCASPGNPVLSPSEKYSLIVTDGNDGTVEYNKFSIASVSGSSTTETVVFSSGDKFRTRDALFFLWGNNDSVWVYSGDTGTFYWEKGGEKEWVKRSFYEKPSEPPELLVRMKPRTFEKNN